MRHSLKYGLFNVVDSSDDKLKTELPKAALAELEKTSGRRTHPASFLCRQIIDAMPAKTEFTVNDIYVLLHRGADDIIVKMSTLRSTLSLLARREDAKFKTASSTGKFRLYVKK